MKFLSVTAVVTIIFLFGVLAGIQLTDTPPTITTQQPATGLVISQDRDSPADHIKESQISVLSDRVEIYIPDKTISWSRYADSNSMDPLLDAGANGIEIIPSSPTDIHEGDIISYLLKGDLVVHRVVKIGYDPQGWYAMTRGDNNPTRDQEKVRFSQVKYILVAIIY